MAGSIEISISLKELLSEKSNSATPKMIKWRSSAKR
jgi:hypothetical protein